LVLRISILLSIRNFCCVCVCVLCCVCVIMSSEYSTKDLVAELHKFGGSQHVFELLGGMFDHMQFGNRNMFDSLGLRRVYPFTKEESEICKKLLNCNSFDAKKSKIHNDHVVMEIIYLMLGERFDTVEWQLRKRDGWTTQVKGNVGNDRIDICVLAENYSFSIGFYDVDDELTFCDKSVVTYRELQVVVAKWISKITPVVE